MCRERSGSNVPEIVLIKKRFTYSFSVFVQGAYKKDNKSLLKLFNGMAMHEKAEILRMDFGALWRYYYMDNDYNRSFNRSKMKYNSLIADGGTRLRKLIHGSSNSPSIWEIPKGKKEPFETEMDAAIREFREETGIQPDTFALMWNAEPLVYTYSDQGVTYHNKYYLASLQLPAVSQRIAPLGSKKEIGLKEPSSPGLMPCTFAPYAHEVECTQWVSLAEIDFLGIKSIYKEHLRQIMKMVFKKFHNKK